MIRKVFTDTNSINREILNQDLVVKNASFSLENELDTSSYVLVTRVENQWTNCPEFKKESYCFDDFVVKEYEQHQEKN